MKIKIKLVIIFGMFIFISMVSFVNAQSKIFSIRINFENSQVSLNSFNIIFGEAPEKYGGLEYIINVYDENNILIYSDGFDAARVSPMADPSWFDDKGNQIVIPEVATTGNLSLTLFLPFFENAKQIVIEKDKEQILKIPIESYFGCNKDGICQSDENSESCPEDCATKNINETSRTNKTQGTTIGGEKTTSPTTIQKIKDNKTRLYAVFILLGILIIFTILLIVVLVRKKND